MRNSLYYSATGVSGVAGGQEHGSWLQLGQAAAFAPHAHGSWLHAVHFSIVFNLLLVCMGRPFSPTGARLMISLPSGMVNDRLVVFFVRALRIY